MWDRMTFFIFFCDSKGGAGEDFFLSGSYLLAGGRQAEQFEVLKYWIKKVVELYDRTINEADYYHR